MFLLTFLEDFLPSEKIIEWCSVNQMINEWFMIESCDIQYSV